MQTVKMVVTGPFSAGKTEFIQSVSEIDVVATERKISNKAEQSVKEATTVAMDFGRITVDEDLVLYLFGTPGQKRFDFMWAILRERAVGLVLLVNADAGDPLAELRDFLAEFADMHRRGGIVVGITRSDVMGGPPIEEFSDLGSGFHIAMRDLDIRGAGNLLGAEQSGFIADNLSLNWLLNNLRTVVKPALLNSALKSDNTPLAANCNNTLLSPSKVVKISTSPFKSAILFSKR